MGVRRSGCEQRHAATVLDGEQPDVEAMLAQRPRATVGFGVHHAYGPERDRVDAFAVSELRMLHHESPTYEEFVRKWTALASSGTHDPGMRGHRTRIYEAFSPDAPVEGREERWAQLYAEYATDDLALLRRLRAVRGLDPRAGTHRPPRLPEALEAVRGRRRWWRLTRLSPRDR